MKSFLSSLTLVMVAQVPLLLKFWFDHREAVSGFKLERQMDAYKHLSALLFKVYQNSQALILLIREGSFPGKDKSAGFSSELRQAYLRNHSDLVDAVRDAEFLLPTRLSVDFSKFLTSSIRIIFKAFDSPESSRAAGLNVEEIWSEQEVLYNSIANQMRLACGIDPLNDPKMVNPRLSTAALLLRETGSVEKN